MEVKTYDLNSYKLHIIKSDKVKTCHMEIHFRDEVKKENIHFKTFLCDILTDCSKKYNTRKNVVIKLEELYKSSFYGTTSKTGGVINTMFVFDFIAPKYISEDNYLENVLELPCEMILNPKIINKEFELNTFNVIKERMKRDIKSINENPVKLSINNSLKVMDEESLTSVSVLGDISSLEDITPTTLFDEYENMIKNNLCDIFIIGDLEFDEVYKIISKKFKLKYIKSKQLNLYIDNKLSKKVKEKNDVSTFVQTNLNLVYNLENLDINDKNINIQVYNYLLGSGGMSSKLYRKLREENSLCYGVYSIYLKYDNLLIVQVSLDSKNKNLAIKLIKECINEMQKGKFTENDFEDAKKNLMLSLEMSLDNNVSLLTNCVFKEYDQLPSIENRMEMLRKVTMEDIVKIAKKVKLNTIYSLEAGGK